MMKLARVLRWRGCHVNETEKPEAAAEQVLRIPQIFVVHIIGEHRDAGKPGHLEKRTGGTNRPASPRLGCPLGSFPGRVL